MNLKLVSNGTPEGTHLIDSESGEIVTGVHSVEWEANVNSPANLLTVRFNNVPAEITTAVTANVKDWDQDTNDFIVKASISENVVATSKVVDGLCSPNDTLVCNAQTGEAIGAIQKINVKIDPQACIATMERIKF